MTDLKNINKEVGDTMSESSGATTHQPAENIGQAVENASKLFEKAMPLGILGGGISMIGHMMKDEMER